MSGQTPTYRPLDNPARPVNFTALGLVGLRYVCLSFLFGGTLKVWTHMK
jgi:hypothetical protein